MTFIYLFTNKNYTGHKNFRKTLVAFEFGISIVIRNDNSVVQLKNLL